MAKMNGSKEGAFRESLKSWGDDIDNRPFIRVKEDKERDAVDYARKHEKIRKEREEVAKITGDKLENIHLWGDCGLNSQTGDIKSWTSIKKEVDDNA